MKIVAKTTDGKYVIAGVYQFCATHGIPLDITLSYFLSNGMIPGWYWYIKEGLNEGANPGTLIGKIEMAFTYCGIRLSKYEKIKLKTLVSWAEKENSMVMNNI